MAFYIDSKKLENFGGHLLSEDDYSYWVPPYWNITKETFYFGRTLDIIAIFSIKSFGDVYKEIKSSILQKNSSFF